VWAELLFTAGAELGEGPIALADGSLAWVDILRGEVHCLSTSGDAKVLERMAEPVGSIAETDDGSIVAACGSGLYALDGGDPRLLVAVPRRAPDLRMNDGKADPAGRFLGGTMTLGTPRPGAGSLWSFGPSGPIELITGVTISNGLAWSADGTTLFYIDTPTHRVDAFDYDVESGRVSGRRTAITLDPDAGDPDGMCIDVDGGLWIAMWGAGTVRRYVDGVLDAIVSVPTPYVTCPVFAGRDLDDLVITTASQPFEGHAPSGAGDIFTARPGVAGRPAYRVAVDLIRQE
jgi:sugar lactone lactonase YvrE